MSSAEMKISDILKYSIKIEHESQLFYEDSKTRVTDAPVVELLTELAAEEVKHEARLTGLLKDLKDGDAENFSRESLDRLIQNRQVTDGAAEKEVLETALEREEHTRDFYRQISTMTNLSDDVIDIFTMLFNQESGHVKRISSKLKSL